MLRIHRQFVGFPSVLAVEAGRRKVAANLGALPLQCQKTRGKGAFIQTAVVEIVGSLQLAIGFRSRCIHTQLSYGK